MADRKKEDARNADNINIYKLKHIAPPFYQPTQTFIPPLPHACSANTNSTITDIQVQQLRYK